MKKPIEEMETTPYGEDYMFPAWLGLVKTSIKNSTITEQFKKDTGIDIVDVVLASGIKEMVDISAGYQKDAIIKWCDFVTKKYWGEEK